MVGIRVEVGDLVQEEVGADAVLNASNPEVRLGSGVSGAIREACGGDAYQQEIERELATRFGRPLGPDDCLVTGAGRARAFRWVLHVPTVDDGTPDPETGGSTGPTRIRRTVRAALAAAAQAARDEGRFGRFVLAVPLLGAGAGGLEPAAAAGAMIDGLEAWAAEGGPAGDFGTVAWVLRDEASAAAVREVAAARGLRLG